jgi:preprotein translocase subunit SecY
VFVLQTAVALVTGSMVVMWISEVITERGIGQGASLVIYPQHRGHPARASVPTIELAQSGDRSTVGGIVVLAAVFLLTIVGIVCEQEQPAASRSRERQAPGRRRRQPLGPPEPPAPQAQRRPG